MFKKTAAYFSDRSFSVTKPVKEANSCFPSSLQIIFLSNTLCQTLIYTHQLTTKYSFFPKCKLFISCLKSYCICIKPDVVASQIHRNKL